MATTTIQGNNGNASLPTGFNCKFNTWSATVNIATVDTSGFSDNGWKTVAPVQLSLTGSAGGTGQFDGTGTAPLPSGLMATATTNLASASGSFTLTATTGCTLGFTGTVTSAAFSRPVAGKLDVTYNFESSGAVTQAWDETA